MSDTKKYNSIVFLTTLSVYLGLVLVGGGAVSPVLAQAALTRNFDIQEEIEHRDDLDKNPDEDQMLSEYLDSYQKLYSLAKDFAKEYHDESDNYGFHCSALRDEKSGRNVKFVEGTGVYSNIFVPQILRIKDVFAPEIAGENQEIKVRLLISHNDFLLKTSFIQKSDLQKSNITAFLDKNLFQKRVQNLEDRLKVYGLKTTVKSKNNQVFIVTRLPRASIDSLLADKNAN